MFDNVICIDELQNKPLLVSHGQTWQITGAGEVKIESFEIR